MKDQVLALINELLKLTENNELQWKNKNPKILSEIPGGNAIVSIFFHKI